MPQESMPIIGRGGRLVMAMQVLADQLFRRIVVVNTAQNHAIRAGSVVEHEFQELLLFFTASQALTFTTRKSLLEKVSKST